MTQVESATETAHKIDAELKDLQATLANIEEARPFEDLTVRNYPFLNIPHIYLFPGRGSR